MDWEKDSWIGEGKVGSTNSDRWEISHLLSQADRSPECLWAAATWQAISLAAFFCYCSFYCCAQCYMVWKEYSFGQFRSSVVPASPPSLLPTPGLLADGEAGVMIDRVRGKCLDTVQALFSNSRDIGGVLPANPNHSTVWAAVKSVSSIPVTWCTCTFAGYSEIVWQGETIFSLEV